MNRAEELNKNFQCLLDALACTDDLPEGHELTSLCEPGSETDRFAFGYLTIEDQKKLIDICNNIPEPTRFERIRRTINSEIMSIKFLIKISFLKIRFRFIEKIEKIRSKIKKNVQ